ncbi:MAG: thioredoxin [Bdellovibrionales bacterium]
MANIESTTDGAFLEVVKSHKLVLVDFWAEWCGPCRALAPKLEEVAKEMGDKLKVVKLNIDENPQSPSEFGVRGIPTMILFKDGQMVDQLVGNLPKDQISSLVSRHLA